MKEISDEKRQEHDLKSTTDRASKDKFKVREQLEMEMGKRVIFQVLLIKRLKPREHGESLKASLSIK